MKFLAYLSLFVITTSVSLANDCNEIKNFTKQNFDRKTANEFEFYRCELINEEFGQIFDEDVSQPGSIEVQNSNACIALNKEGGGRVLVQDKNSGFELLTRSNFGNSNYGNTVFSAFIHDEEQSSMTRVDFDKQRLMARLSKWKIGVFRNKMLYNYQVQCQRI